MSQSEEANMTSSGIDPDCNPEDLGDELKKIGDLSRAKYYEEQKLKSKQRAIRSKYTRKDQKFELSDRIIPRKKVDYIAMMVEIFAMNRSPEDCIEFITNLPQ